MFGEQQQNKHVFGLLIRWFRVRPPGAPRVPVLREVILTCGDAGDCTSGGYRAATGVTLADDFANGRMVLCTRKLTGHIRPYRVGYEVAGPLSASILPTGLAARELVSIPPDAMASLAAAFG